MDLDLPGAQPIGYDTIRDTSGVLGYAEPLLGPAIATKYQVPVGPGASAVEQSTVAGSWELPLGIKPADVEQALRSRGRVERIRNHSDGQIWIADFTPRTGGPLRLLLINGDHPAFERNAVPEVRPGRHVYLIAYALPQ